MERGLRFGVAGLFLGLVLILRGVTGTLQTSSLSGRKLEAPVAVDGAVMERLESSGAPGTGEVTVEDENGAAGGGEEKEPSGDKDTNFHPSKR